MKMCQLCVTCEAASNSMIIYTGRLLLSNIILNMTSQQTSNNRFPSKHSQPALQDARKESGYVPGQVQGKWSTGQQVRYVALIQHNKSKMRSKQKRSSNAFFELMARFISSRNALQCRSHHQKLQAKYQHVTTIINIFKPSFDPQDYKAALKSLKGTNNASQPRRIHEPIIDVPVKVEEPSQNQSNPHQGLPFLRQSSSQNQENLQVNYQYTPITPISYQQYVPPAVSYQPRVGSAMMFGPGMPYYGNGMGWWNFSLQYY